MLPAQPVEIANGTSVQNTLNSYFSSSCDVDIKSASPILPPTVAITRHPGPAP